MAILLSTKVAVTGQTPLSKLFDVLGGELSAVRAMGLRLEDQLVALTARLGLEAERVRDLQEFDLLLQHIDALRSLMDALSVAHADADGIDLEAAAGCITLGEVRQRVLGAFGGVDVAEIGSGDVDFL